MKVLVIGPSVTRALGGMAVVIRGIRESELLNREFEIDIFPSCVDGNLALRLGYSVLGYFRFLLCYRKYDLFHINTAEKGSTFRKNFYLKKIKKAGKKASYISMARSILPFMIVWEIGESGSWTDFFTGRIWCWRCRKTGDGSWSLAFTRVPAGR